MALSLEVFETDPNAAQGLIVLDQTAFAREKASSFDDGYRAGIKAAAEMEVVQAARSKTDLSQHLQKLSFTYHEAQAHVLTALRPLLQHMVDQILPQIARESMAPLVVETLIPLASRLGHAPLVLRVNPAMCSAVQVAIEAHTSLPLTIQGDPGLGDGQVHLQFGTAEADVDLDQATADIAAALRDFYALSGKDRLYG